MCRPPARAAANARSWVSGSGNACSGPGEVEPDEAVAAEPRGGLGERDVVGRVVRAERGGDEPGHDPVPVRGRARPADHRRDPVGEGEAARDVEQRPPADLDVADVVGRLRLDQLVGDPLERLGVLHERDRQVEPLGAARPGRGSAPARRARRTSRPTSRGASTPRDAASSSAVATRSEPSRWRWSSALGIASMRRRVGGAASRVAGALGGSATTRCYDAAPMSRQRRPRRPRRRVDSRSSAVLALGAAGIVATMAHQPGTAARAELTYAGDAALEPGLASAASRSSTRSPDRSPSSASSAGARSATCRPATATTLDATVDRRPDARVDDRAARDRRSASSSRRCPGWVRTQELTLLARTSAAASTLALAGARRDERPRARRGRGSRSSSAAASRITTLLTEHDTIDRPTRPRPAARRSTPTRSRSSTSRTG